MRQKSLIFVSFYYLYKWQFGCWLDLSLVNTVTWGNAIQFWPNASFRQNILSFLHKDLCEMDDSSGCANSYRSGEQFEQLWYTTSDGNVLYQKWNLWALRYHFQTIIFVEDFILKLPFWLCILLKIMHLNKTIWTVSAEDRQRVISFIKFGQAVMKNKSFEVFPNIK